MLSDAMVTNIIDISQVNIILLKLQKKLLELQEAHKQKKGREQDREQVKRDYNERWEEEEQRRRQEREKVEDRRRNKDEWRRINKDKRRKKSKEGVETTGRVSKTETDE